MSPEETETICPVSGCFYTGPPASVAGHVSEKKDTAHDWDRLGYDGANQYKREQRSSPQNDTSPAFIGWLTDSHIGKKTGGYGSNSWQLSPLADLSSMVEKLRSFNLDTVVYTGDLFQNDKDGIDGADKQLVQAILETRLTDFLPIKYIRGNHARDAGKRIWKSFEEQQIAEPLSTDPSVVGNTAVYGIDYHNERWWKESPPKLQPTNAEYRIVCLHQSVEPYRSSEYSEINLQTILPKLCRSSSELPDIVLLGHLHEVIDDEITVKGKEINVLNCGATTRLGQYRDSFPPSCGVVLTPSDSPRYTYISNE